MSKRLTRLEFNFFFNLRQPDNFLSRKFKNSKIQKFENEELAGQRGYTSFGREHAKQSQVADLKEFFQIGQELEHPAPSNANVPVADRPEFLKTGIELYQNGKIRTDLTPHRVQDLQYGPDPIFDGSAVCIRTPVECGR